MVVGEKGNWKKYNLIYVNIKFLIVGGSVGSGGLKKNSLLNVKIKFLNSQW